MKSAWLAGGTGLVGNVLLELLINSHKYETIHFLSRRPVEINNPKVEVHIVDFENLNLRKSSGDDFFCCLGTTIKVAGSQEAFRKVDHDAVVNFAKVAQQNSAHAFIVVSALGASGHSKIFYSRIKGEMEEAVKALKLRATFILQPSLLLGNRREFRTGEKIMTMLAPAFSLLLQGPFKKYRPVQARRVAKAAFEAAQTEKIGFYILESDKL